MAATSAPTSEPKGMESSDSCTMGGSMESECHTAIACKSECATISSLSFFSAGSESLLARTESGKRSSILEREEQIERSKVHWSQLSEPDFDPDEEGVVAEIDNREVFKALQLHPTWCHFFRTFGYDLGIWESSGELVVGEKFAEGGQAELYHAQITWWDPKMNGWDWEDGTEWVLKVFKKGTLLRYLQSQWPHGYLEWWVKDLERSKLGKPASTRYNCEVKYGTLLKDGRFVYYGQGRGGLA